MHPLAHISISSLLLLLPLGLADAQDVATQPDSVVVRNAKGHVISRSIFERKGNVTLVTSTDGCLHTASVLDQSGRETSRSVFNHGALTTRADYSTSPDGRRLSLTTTAIDGNQTLTTYDYSPSGHIAAETTYAWDAAELDWTPTARYDYTYTRQPLPLPQRLFAVKTFSKWDSATQQWTPTDTATSYDYDAAGRETQRCTSFGRCHTMTYDADGRLTSTLTSSYADCGFTNAQKETFTYDKAGRLASRCTTGANGQILSQATYYYSTRATRTHATKSPAPNRVETLDSDSRLICRNTYYYDSAARTTGIATDSLRADSTTTRHETAYIYNPTGRLLQTISATITPDALSNAESDAPDDDIPFSTYTVTTHDEQGNPAMATSYATQGGTVTSTTRWANRYDSQGRLTSAVRSVSSGDGHFSPADSVATAYDVYSSRESVAPDSASVISRAWMRLAGFFSSKLHKSAAKDSVAVADDGSYMVERVSFEWRGKWVPTVKTQRVYGDEGHLVSEYSYQKGGAQGEWTLSRKEEYSYDGGRLAKVEIFAPVAGSGKLEPAGVRILHYY